MAEDYKFKKLRNTATGEIEANPVDVPTTQPAVELSQAQIKNAGLTGQNSGKNQVDPNAAPENLIDGMGRTDYEADVDYTSGAFNKEGQTTRQDYESEQQAAYEKVANVIGRGISKGLIGVVEPVTQGLSYIMGGAETMAGLEIKNFTDKVKEGVTNSMDVHESTLSKNAGIGEQFFRWSTAEGLVESATQFVVMQRISANAISKLGSVMYKAGASAESVVGAGAFANKAQKTIAEAGRLMSKDVYFGFTNRVSSKSLINAFSSNALEGIVMAKDMETEMLNRYASTLDDHRGSAETKNIIRENIEEAKNKLQVYNTALVFNDIAGLTRVTGYLSKAAERSFKAARAVKDYPILSIGEYAEESGQGILQGYQMLKADERIQKEYDESTRDPLVEANLNKIVSKGEATVEKIRQASMLAYNSPGDVEKHLEEVSKSMSDYIIDHATSDENIVEGLTGLVGGAPQFGMIRALESASGTRGERKAAQEQQDTFRSNLMDKLTANELERSNNNADLNLVGQDLDEMFNGETEGLKDELNVTSVLTDYEAANDIISGLESGYVVEMSEMFDDHRSEAADNLKNGVISQEQYETEMRRNDNAERILNTYKNMATYANGSKQLAQARKIETAKALFSLEENMDKLRTYKKSTETSGSEDNNVTESYTDTDGNKVELSSANESQREEIVTRKTATLKTKNDSLAEINRAIKNTEKSKSSDRNNDVRVALERDKQKVESDITVLENEIAQVNDIAKQEAEVAAQKAEEEAQTAKATAAKPGPTPPTASQSMAADNTFRPDPELVESAQETLNYAKEELESAQIEFDSGNAEGSERLDAAKASSSEAAENLRKALTGEDLTGLPPAPTGDAPPEKGDDVIPNAGDPGQSDFKSLEEELLSNKANGATEEELEETRNKWRTPEQKEEARIAADEAKREAEIEVMYETARSKWGLLSIDQLRKLQHTPSLAEFSEGILYLIFVKEEEMRKAIGDTTQLSEMKADNKQASENEEFYIKQHEDTITSTLAAIEKISTEIESATLTKTGKERATTKKKKETLKDLKSTLKLAEVYKSSAERTLELLKDDLEKEVKRYRDKVSSTILEWSDSMDEESVINTADKFLNDPSVTDEVKEETEEIRDRALNLIRIMNSMILEGVTTAYTFDKFIAKTLEENGPLTEEEATAMTHEINAAYLKLLNGAKENQGPPELQRIIDLRDRALLESNTLSYEDAAKLSASIAVMNSKKNKLRRLFSKTGDSHDAYNRAKGLVGESIKKRIAYLKETKQESTTEYMYLTLDSHSLQEKGEFMIQESGVASKLNQDVFNDSTDLTKTELAGFISKAEDSLSELKTPEALIAATHLLTEQERVNNLLKNARKDKKGVRMRRLMMDLSRLKDTAINKDYEELYSRLYGAAKDEAKSISEASKATPPAKKKDITEPKDGQDSVDPNDKVEPESEDDKGEGPTATLGDEPTKNETTKSPGPSGKVNEEGHALLDNGQIDLSAMGQKSDVEALVAQALEEPEGITISKEDNKALAEESLKSQNAAKDSGGKKRNPMSEYVGSEDLRSRVLGTAETLIGMHHKRTNAFPTKDTLLSAIIKITQADPESVSPAILDVLDGIYNMESETLTRPVNMNPPTHVATQEEQVDKDVDSTDNSIRQTTATLSMSALSIVWDKTSAANYRLVKTGAPIKLVINRDPDQKITVGGVGIPMSEFLANREEAIAASKLLGPGEEVRSDLQKYLTEDFSGDNPIPVAVMIQDGTTSDGKPKWIRIGHVRTRIGFQNLAKSDNEITQAEVRVQIEALDEMREDIFNRGGTTAVITGRTENVSLRESDGKMIGIAVIKANKNESTGKRDMESAALVFKDDKDVVLGFMGNNGELSARTMEMFKNNPEIGLNRDLLPGTPMTILRIEETNKWVAEPLTMNKLSKVEYNAAKDLLIAAIGSDSKTKKDLVKYMSPSQIRTRIAHSIGVNYIRPLDLSDVKELKLNITLEPLAKDPVTGKTIEDYTKPREWTVTIDLNDLTHTLKFISTSAIQTGKGGNSTVYKHKLLSSTVKSYQGDKATVPVTPGAVKMTLKQPGLELNKTGEGLPFRNVDADKLFQTGDQNTIKVTGTSKDPKLSWESMTYRKYVLRNSTTAVRRAKKVEEETATDDEPGIISYFTNTRITFLPDTKLSSIQAKGKGVQKTKAVLKKAKPIKNKTAPIQKASAEDRAKADLNSKIERLDKNLEISYAKMIGIEDLLNEVEKEGKISIAEMKTFLTAQGINTDGMDKSEASSAITSHLKVAPESMGSNLFYTLVKDYESTEKAADDSKILRNNLAKRAELSSQSMASDASAGARPKGLKFGKKKTKATIKVDATKTEDEIFDEVMKRLEASIGVQEEVNTSRTNRELIIKRLPSEVVPHTDPSDLTVAEIQEGAAQGAVTYSAGVIERYGHEDVSSITKKVANMLSSFTGKRKENMNFNSTERVIIRGAFSRLAVYHGQFHTTRRGLRDAVENAMRKDINQTIAELDVFIATTSDEKLLRSATEYRALMKEFKPSYKVLSSRIVDMMKAKTALIQEKRGNDKSFADGDLTAEVHEARTNALELLIQKKKEDIAAAKNGERATLTDNEKDYEFNSLMDSGISAALRNSGFITTKKNDKEGWQESGIEKDPLSGASKAVKAMLSSFSTYRVNTEGELEVELGLTGQPLPNNTAYINLMLLFSQGGDQISLKKKIAQLRKHVEENARNPIYNAGTNFYKDLLEMLESEDMPDSNKREFNKVMNKNVESYITVSLKTAGKGNNFSQSLFFTNPNYSTAFTAEMSQIKARIDGLRSTDGLQMVKARAEKIRHENSSATTLGYSATSSTMLPFLKEVLLDETVSPREFVQNTNIKDLAKTEKYFRSIEDAFSDPDEGFAEGRVGDQFEKHAERNRTKKTGDKHHKFYPSGTKITAKGKRVLGRMAAIREAYADVQAKVIMDYMVVLGVDPTSQGVGKLAKFIAEGNDIRKVNLSGEEVAGVFTPSEMYDKLNADVFTLINDGTAPITPAVRAMVNWVANNTGNSLNSSMTRISNKKKSGKSTKSQTKKLANFTDPIPLFVKIRRLSNQTRRDRFKEDAFASTSSILKFLDDRMDETKREFANVFKVSGIHRSGLLSTDYSDINEADSPFVHTFNAVGGYLASVEASKSLVAKELGDNWRIGNTKYTTLDLGDKYKMKVRAAKMMTTAFSDSNSPFHMDGFDFDAIEVSDAGEISVKDDVDQNYLKFYADSTILPEVNRMIVHINNSNFKNKLNESGEDFHTKKTVNVDLSFNFEELNMPGETGQNLYETLKSIGLKKPLTSLFYDKSLDLSLRGSSAVAVDVRKRAESAAKNQLVASADEYLAFMVKNGLLKKSAKGNYFLTPRTENIEDFKLLQKNVTGAEEADIVRTEQHNLLAETDKDNKGTRTEILSRLFFDPMVTPKGKMKKAESISTGITNLLSTKSKADFIEREQALVDSGKPVTAEKLLKIAGLDITTDEIKFLAGLTELKKSGKTSKYDFGVEGKNKTILEVMAEAEARKQAEADGVPFPEPPTGEELLEEAIRVGEERAIKIYTKLEKGKAADHKVGEMIIPLFVTKSQMKSLTGGLANDTTKGTRVNKTTLQVMLLQRAYATGFFQANMQQLVQGDMAYAYKDGKLAGKRKPNGDVFTEQEIREANVAATKVNYGKRNKKEVTSLTQVSDARDIITLSIVDTKRDSVYYTGKPITANGETHSYREGNPATGIDTMDAAVVITPRARITDLIVEGYITQEEGNAALIFLDPPLGITGPTMEQYKAMTSAKAAKMVMSSTRKPVSSSFVELENDAGQKINEASLVKMGESMLTRSLVGANSDRIGVKQLELMMQEEKRINGDTPPGPDYVTVRITPATAHKMASAVNPVNLDTLVQDEKTGIWGNPDGIPVVNSLTPISREDWGEQNVVRYKEGKKSKDGYQPKDVIQSAIDEDTQVKHRNSAKGVIQVAEKWNDIQKNLGKLALRNIDTLLTEVDASQVESIINSIYDSPEVAARKIISASRSAKGDAALAALIMGSMRSLSDGPLNPNDPMVEFLDIEPYSGRFKNPMATSPFTVEYANFIASAFEKVSAKTRRAGFSLPLMSDESVDLRDAGMVGGSKILLTSAYMERMENKPNDKPAPALVGSAAQILMKAKFSYLDPVTGITENIDMHDPKYRRTHTDKDGKTREYIDTSSLPKEALEHFAYRVPTQDYSMTSSIEVIGFLPEEIATSVIAPKEFVDLMGSDFDIDKLFSFSYNLAKNNDGDLVRVSAESMGGVTMTPAIEKAILENEELDVMLSIIEDPTFVKREMVQSLDTSEEFKHVANILDELSGNAASTKGSPLGMTYGEAKRNNAVGAAASIGTYALYNRVFSQLRKLKIPVSEEGIKLGDATVSYFGQEGDNIFAVPTEMSKNGKPKKTNGKWEDRTKLWHETIKGNISAMISLSVDDETLQLLYKLGVNDEKFHDKMQGLIMVGISAKNAALIQSLKGSKNGLNPLEAYNIRAKAENRSLMVYEGQDIEGLKNPITATSEMFSMSGMTAKEFTDRLIHLRQQFSAYEKASDKNSFILNEISDTDLTDMIALKLFQDNLQKSFGELTAGSRWAVNMDSKGLSRNIEHAMITAYEAEAVHGDKWDAHFSKVATMQNSRDLLNVYTNTLTGLYSRTAQMKEVMNYLKTSGIEMNSFKIASAYRSMAYQNIKPDAKALVERLSTLLSDEQTDEVKNFVANNAFLSRLQIDGLSITYSSSEAVDKQDVVDSLADIKKSGLVGGLDMAVMYRDLVDFGLSDFKTNQSYGKSYARFIAASEHRRAYEMSSKAINSFEIAVDIAIHNPSIVPELVEGKNPKIYREVREKLDVDGAVESTQTFIHYAYVDMNGNITDPDNYRSIEIIEDEYQTVREQKSQAQRAVAPASKMKDVIDTSALLERVFPYRDELKVKLFFKAQLKGTRLELGPENRHVYNEKTLATAGIDIEAPSLTDLQSGRNLSADARSVKTAVAHEGTHSVLTKAIELKNDKSKDTVADRTGQGSGRLGELFSDLDPTKKEKVAELNKIINRMEEARVSAVLGMSKLVKSQFDEDRNSDWSNLMQAQLTSLFFVAPNSDAKVFRKSAFFNLVTAADLKEMYPEDSEAELILKRKSATEDTVVYDAMVFQGIIKAIKTKGMLSIDRRGRLKLTVNKVSTTGPSTSVENLEAITDTVTHIDSAITEERPGQIAAVRSFIKKRDAQKGGTDLKLLEEAKEQGLDLLGLNLSTSVMSGLSGELSKVRHKPDTVDTPYLKREENRKREHYHYLNYGLHNLHEFAASAYSFGTKRTPADKWPGFAQLTDIKSPLSHEAKTEVSSIFAKMMDMIRDLINAIMGDKQGSNKLWENVMYAGVLANQGSFFNVVRTGNVSATEVTYAPNDAYSDIINLC